MAYSNQKLISLINSFSKKELEQFRIFISTPFFTKGRNYITYLDDILDPKKTSDSKKLNGKKKIKGKGDSLSEQTISNRCSELYKLGEEFLIYTGLCENKNNRNQILLRKLNEKNLHKMFKSNYEKTINNVNQEGFDFTKLKDLTNFSEILFDHYRNRNKIENLYSEFYDYSKLVLCQNLLVLFNIGFEFNQLEIENRIFKPNYIVNFLKELRIDNFISEIKNSDLMIFKITAMNYYLLKAYGNDKKGKLFSESRNIFIELKNDLKENYKINVFTCMINLCINKLNNGDLNYRYILFDLYNEKLNQNLTSDLEIRPYTFNHFRDYIYIGISLKRYDWVENFIKTYSENLPPGLRDSESRLSYAKLYFEKKQFEKSLEKLEAVKASHHLQYIDISLLKLCNYFELMNYEEAFLEIDKLNHYIKNHKEIKEILYKYAVNFMKIYKKLVKYFTEPNKSDPELIESEFKKIKHISKSGWLADKLSKIV